ncbi:unnamed protein product, partial [Brassica oleracea]
VAGLTKLHHQDNFDFQRKLRDQKYSLKRGYCGREFCRD